MSVTMRSPRGGGAVAETRSATTTKSMLPSYWSSQLPDQSRKPNLPSTVTVLSLMVVSSLISRSPRWWSFPPLYSAAYPVSPATAAVTVRGNTTVAEAGRGPLPLTGSEKSREPARKSMRTVLLLDFNPSFRLKPTFPIWPPNLVSPYNSLRSLKTDLLSSRSKTRRPTRRMARRPGHFLGHRSHAVPSLRAPRHRGTEHLAHQPIASLVPFISVSH